MIVEGEEVANRILLALPRESVKAIEPHLKVVELQRGQVISERRKENSRIFFINRGLVSLVKIMSDGRSVELGAKGIEGVLPAEELLGFPAPLYDSVVQIPGSALVATRDFLQPQAAKDSKLRKLAEGYFRALSDQIAQTAACNRLHSLSERCCRWLLIAHDSARSDSFPLIHEFLAMMLGIHRSRVSSTLTSLRMSKLIHYARGSVTIMDRRGLEASACECYETIRREFDKLFRGPE